MKNSTLIDLNAVVAKSRKFMWLLEFLIMLLLMALQPASKAVGFRLPNQDPEGIARGNAEVATADNPSAIYYNPAGISQLEGDQVRVGLYLISADTHYTSTSGGSAQTDASLQPVPQVYFTHSFPNLPITLGLGVYAPYGLSLDWGSNPPFGAIAQKGKLLYATFNPVLAWQPLSTLSLAIGPTVNYVDADLENLSFKFRGSDTAYGFTAGVLWRPHPKWSFGAKYHSATDFVLSGHSEVPAYNLGSSVTLAKAHFPQFVVGGISFRPTPDWNIECDVDWTDWESEGQIVFRRADGVAVPLVFNYRSSLMYEFGITRQLGGGWFVSTGYIYSENSSPDANFNPLVPDGNLHLGSLGVGHHGRKLDWTVAYHFAYGERKVTADLSPLADGNYKTFNNAVNISGTYKF